MNHLFFFIKGLLVALLCSLPLLAEEKLPAGASKLPNGDLLVAGITVRRQAKELAFPGAFKQEAGALEVIIAHPHGRVHETLLTTEIKAIQLQTMLYLLGAQNGARLPGGKVPQGTLVDIFLEWTDQEGKLHRRPVEDWILDRRTNQPMKPIGWTFVGSTIKQGAFLADSEGNVALNYSVGETVLDLPDPKSQEDDELHTINTAQAQPQNITIVFKPRL